MRLIFLYFFSFASQHSTEAIMIHSIQTAPEETVLIRTASGETVKKSWDDDVIPQQLHVSRLPSGSLSLGPGQVAIVPVTFLPRYPHLLNNNNQDSSYKDTSPPLLSPTARADLVQLVGEEVLVNAEYMKETPLFGSSSSSTRRSNLDPSVLPEGDEFEVSTTVVVDTSRGVVKLPITASSVRFNEYGLPDVIRFKHPEPVREKESDSPTVDADLKSKEKWKMKPASESSSNRANGVVLIDTLYASQEDASSSKLNRTPPKPDRECYDLFLTNPSQEQDLEISEVLISRPELMSVEFDPKRLLLPPDIMLVSTGPSQVIREWTEDGPMYLPADSEDNYIATVCTSVNGGVAADESSGVYLDEMANWIDSGSPERSLGFLQIRTDSETLFIGLERADESPRSGGSAASSDPPNLSVSLAPPLSNTNSVVPSSSALLKAVPDRVDFHLMSSASPANVAKIGLQNKSPVPIRIMRVSVGMDTSADENLVETAKKIGLKMNVNIGANGLVVLSDSSPSKAFVLPAASTVEDALILTCSFSWESSFISLNQESFYFTGTLVLRGTMDTELQYGEWRDEMLRNPYRDLHLVLEIPYTISVLNGRVEVIIERSTHPYPQIWGAQPWDRSGRAVSAFFFPMTQFEVIDDPNDPLPPQKYRGTDEIGHDLRIMSNMAIPLKLEGAEIYDANFSLTTENGNDSLCQRFNVSLTNPFKVTSEYPDFEELGFLTLSYDFDQPGNRAGQNRRKVHEKQDLDQVFPTTCYLNVLTSPVDTGVHRIPLIIFPGQLDVSPPSSRSGMSLEKPKEDVSDQVEPDSGVTTTVVMGFDRLLSWFRASVVGNSLRDLLGTLVEDKKSLKSDARLLGKYLFNICKRSPNIESMTLRPILLKAGAIEHGEMVRTPLYLTNHNPAPITVTIDVGEVEGMSIALARDATGGRGDGNNMLDYLPKASLSVGQSERSGLVKDGKYEGQPMLGLRQFLLSNEKAIAFSSLFPFRDAISTNPASMARLPLLKPLYKWHSHVEFHREPLPLRLGPNSTSRCAGSLRPSLYNSFEDAATKTRQQKPTGPFIISGDKSIARPLKLCWDSSMENTDLSDGTKIVIPPGGVARFEVRVRAPPQSYLMNDISQFLATGLVLSTNYGEVMPIIATFEALQGQLHVSHVSAPSKDETDYSEELEIFHDDLDVDVIGVPLGLFWETSSHNASGSTSLSIPPAQTDISSRNTKVNRLNLSIANDTSQSQRGVPLFVRSSFSREVRLLKVESCNPWFEVVLRESAKDLEFDEDLGINIGAVYSKVACNPGSDDSEEYPSYYQCALKWLVNRSELQPRGCGLLPTMQKRNSEEEGNVDATHGGAKRAIQAFERALRVLKKAKTTGDSDEAELSGSIIPFQDTESKFHFRDSAAMKSGTRRRDGFLAPVVLDIFAETWDAWRVASEYGLRAMSSSLRATIAYNTFSKDDNDNAGRQNIGLSMHNLAVESVLSTPKLFDCDRAKQRAPFAESTAGESPSIIEFPSTLVGTVVSLTIPLRNPTSVPIRVRVSTAPPIFASEKGPADRYEGDFSVDETLRDRFLQSRDAPYVQNGQANIIQNENAQHLWWDGGGAFFVSDERGDVVRSHHNITIRAGAGAHVSLVNPSLHANVAFLVGCGIRCGLRDDPQVTKASESVIDPKLTSPIGASAAAGIALMGRKRSHLPQVNAMGVDEPNVHAGGSPLPGSGGPAAFAVPYSALDEIVIPPYGIGEVGPLFFRPPGRYGVLGCELATESEAHHWGVKTAEVCEAQNFEAMVFLENSLTGLERVILRGKGMWERLYFLDPPAEEGEDDFGDIEFRNGRPTLLFAGTSSKNQLGSSQSNGSRWKFTSFPKTVVKEVLVHNGGDVLVDIAYVYFADTSKIMDKRWPPAGIISQACSFGSFRLLNCWESDQRTFEVNGETVQNVRAGFEIRPGEKRSLFVEHVPDCTKREEFVTLNVEYRRENPSSNFAPILDRGILSLSRSGEVRNSKANEWGRSFRQRKHDLLVGYQMNEDDFAACMPVDIGYSQPVPFGEANALLRARQSKGLSNNSTQFSDLTFQRSSAHALGRQFLAMFFSLIVLTTAAALLACSWFARHQASGNFWSTLRGARSKNEEGVSSNQAQNITHSNWPAAFRCLARADPTSTELQTLGREQIRQVILGRYRTTGVLPPQCFNSAGVLSRERVGTAGGNASRQRGGKDGVGGNERIRTLSDAIFQNVSAPESESVRNRMPAGLGWRTAFSRGIINESTISMSPIELKTIALLHHRRKLVPPELSVEEDSETMFDRMPESEEKDDATITETEDNNADGRESVDPASDAISTSDSEGTEPVKVESATSKEKPVEKGETRKEPNSAESTSPSQVTNKTFAPKSNGGKNHTDQNVPGRRQKTTGPPPATVVSGTGGASRKQTLQKDTSENKNDVPSSREATKVPGRDKGKSSTGTKELRWSEGSSDTSTSLVSGGGESSTAGQKRKPAKAERVQQGTTKKQGAPKPAPLPKNKNSTAPTSSSRLQPKAPGAPKANAPSHASESTIRPPPGLAPPPGFGTQTAALGKSNNIMLPLSPSRQLDLGPMLTAVLSNPDAILDSASPVSSLPFSHVTAAEAANNHLLFPATVSLGDTIQNVGEITELPTPLPPASPPIGAIGSSMGSIGMGRVGIGYTSALAHTGIGPITPLLDKRTMDTDGFDVMDFLDSILDDGNRDEEPEATATGGPGGPGGPGVLLPASSTVPVLSNPWASETKSRASAYGISFDDNEDVSSESTPDVVVRVDFAADDTSRGLANIPLLTPAAILSAGQDGAFSDDKQSSFYASLMGE
jgi:hypothetical protein